MPKLAWVLLPLAATALWLAWRAWRGRLPSRAPLNVLFSLLLLGYVGGTAGLGIFWVANQQLPVFDWHYLFGYTTVLVLLVHLGFNLRIVGQHLRRAFVTRQRGPDAAPGSAPSEAAGAGAARRRPLLGAAGAAALAAAGGLGYFVGLRHGRTELRLASGSRPLEDAGRGDPAARAGASDAAPVAPATAAAPATASDAARAWAVVEQFHAFSAHSRTRVLRHAASADWGDAPPPFKHYEGSERLRLPAVAAAADATPDAGTPGLAALGTWLWHTAGISERRGGIAFRTSPSSGALFATELYVLPLQLHGLEPGPWWHYEAQTHALQRVPRAAAADATAALHELGPLALPARCRALVVASAVFARSGHKYGDRTYRYVLADLGHALENLRRAADALGGLRTTLLPRFDEAALAASLALDERREGVLAVAALAPPASTPAPALRAQTAADASDARWRSALGAAGIGSATGTAAPGLGLTEAMHAATSLRAAGPQPERAAPAGAAVSAPGVDAAGSAPAAAASRGSDAARSPAAEPTHALPAPRALAADPLPLIARRRSRRRYTGEPLSRQQLADVLHAMTAPAPLLSPAVRINVLTPAVTGLPAAAWRVLHGAAQPGATDAPWPLRLHRRVVHGPALRRHARAAALDQDVIGDAAVVFVLSLERTALRADPAGAARGYRHGFLEAGLVGERIYLAAGALGLGACAVGAFYDDEAAALVGLDTAREWPVHFAALGVPA